MHEQDSAVPEPPAAAFPSRRPPHRSSHRRRRGHSKPDGVPRPPRPTLPPLLDLLLPHAQCRHPGPATRAPAEGPTSAAETDRKRGGDASHSLFHAEQARPGAITPCACRDALTASGCTWRLPRVPTLRLAGGRCHPPCFCGKNNFTSKNKKKSQYKTFAREKYSPGQVARPHGAGGVWGPRGVEHGTAARCACPPGGWAAALRAAFLEVRRVQTVPALRGDADGAGWKQRGRQGGRTVLCNENLNHGQLQAALRADPQPAAAPRFVCVDALRH